MHLCYTQDNNMQEAAADGTNDGQARAHFWSHIRSSRARTDILLPCAKSARAWVLRPRRRSIITSTLCGRRGPINMDGKKNRTISLPDRLPIGKIPVVGVVTAGVPILAVENIEGYLPGTETGCFALRVRGDSMINAGILSGDKVVVRPRRLQKTGRSSWRCWTTLPPSSAFTAKRARSGFCRRTLRMSPSTAPIAQFWVLSKPSSANTEY